MGTVQQPTTPLLSFERNVAWSALNKAIYLGVLVAWSALTARLLGPEGKGVLSLIVTFWGTAGLILGVNLIYPHQYLAAKRQYAVPTIAQFTMAFVLLITALSAGAFHLSYPLLRIYLFKDIQKPLVWLGFGLLPLTQLVELLGAIWRGLRDFRVCTFAAMASEGARLAGLIALMIYVGADVEKVLLVALGGTAVGLIYYLARVLRETGWRGLVPRLHLDYAGKAFSLSLKSWLEIITQQLNYRLGVFVIAAFLQHRAVGLYYVATRVAELPSMIGPTVGPVLLAEVAAQEAQQSGFTLSVLRQVFLGAVMLALLVGLTGRWLLAGLFGAQFAEGFPALLVLLPGTVALSAHSILGNALKGQGLPEYVTYSAVVGLLFAVPLNLLLVPRWGMVGAAAAGSFSYLAVALFIVWSYRKKTGCSLRAMVPSWRDVTKLKSHAWSIAARARAALRGPVHRTDPPQ